MDKLLIEGGVALHGEVTISGAKNSALPILASSLLSDETMEIANVPHLHDVTTTIELLGRMGLSIVVDEKKKISLERFIFFKDFFCSSERLIEFILIFELYLLAS